MGPRPIVVLVLLLVAIAWCIGVVAVGVAAMALGDYLRTVQCVDPAMIAGGLLAWALIAVWWCSAPLWRGRP